MNQRTITVSFSHIETTKILIPALEALLLRVHELVQDAEDEPPYARWVRDTSYDLLAALRQQLSAVRWGEGLLRIELDPDRVGLLAAALGGLRRRMETTDREGTTSALTVTRQRLWLTIPFEFPLAWWLSHDVVQGELLPLLRASYARTDDASERSHAERILRSTERVLSLSDSEALRLETALADLAWLATAAERTPSARRLHGLLEHLLDPLVQERYRTYRSGQRERVTGQSHATFTPPSGDGPASHSRSRAEADTAARPPSATAAPGQPGSVWRRLAAAMLDGIVFWVFSALLGALVSVLFVGESPGLVVLPPGVYDALSSLIGLALGIGVPYAYWVYPVGRWGATLGKRAFGLMVVDRRGAPPGQAKALGRALLVILLGGLALLPWWPVPFRIDRRGLHDLATDVWVIEGT